MALQSNAARSPWLKKPLPYLNHFNDNKVAKQPLRSVATLTNDLICTIEDKSIVPLEDILTQIEGSITIISSIKLGYETNKMFGKIVKMIEQYANYWIKNDILFSTSRNDFARIH